MTAPGPKLLAHLDGHHSHAVNDALFFPELDAVISVSDDSTLLCWLKRDSGQFWPSVHQTLAAAASAVVFDPESRELYAGLANGDVWVYTLAEDFNGVVLKTQFKAHAGRVSAMVLDKPRELLLTAGKDKEFRMYSITTGYLLGRLPLDAQCTTLQYDAETQNAFIGDYHGDITVVKIDGSSLTKGAVLQGHSGSIRALVWNEEHKLLFSGSFDKMVMVWDIGGRKGVSYELRGHGDKVQGLVFLPETQQLVSAGDDRTMVVWDIAADRTKVPAWVESDNCQLCGAAFFWNFQAMWEAKTVEFNRQHHCRRCGKAVCNACSPNMSSFPKMGYEFPVRMCNECMKEIKPEDKQPLAKMYPARHQVVSMRLVAAGGSHDRTLVTCGKDHAIKIWSIEDMLVGVTSQDSPTVVSTSQGSSPAGAAASATKASDPPAAAETADAAAEPPATQAEVVPAGGLADLVADSEEADDFDPFSH